MQKRLIATVLLIGYGVMLVKIMVFKDLPVIRVGQIMLNFAGTDGGHPPNFVPFTTIVPYLFGYKGLIIAGINLVGNIVLLVPVGLLLPFVFPIISWKRSFLLALASGLVIEIMQTALHVGIFDIDDVILNAFGVMIGFTASIVLMKWVRQRNYQKIFGAMVACLAVFGVFYATVIYPISHQGVAPSVDANGDRDLCGRDRQRGILGDGTGGKGQSVSVPDNSCMMSRNAGIDQRVELSDRARIETSAGSVSFASLKVDDRVTLVGGPNPDGSFTADTVVVCKSE